MKRSCVAFLCAVLIPAFMMSSPAWAQRIFAPAVAYDSGSNTAGPVTVADLNGDGKQDVLVGNPDHNAFSVLLGKGDGSLQPPVTYSVGAQVTGIAVADLDGDGKLDVAVSTYYEAGNSNSGGVAVLLGRGDGTFHSPAIMSSGASFSTAIAVADINGDSHPDLLVANQCLNQVDCGIPFSDSHITILLGNGNGTFQTPLVRDAASNVQSLAVADLNGDGALDLVSLGDGYTVSVELGNGDASFQPIVDYATSGFPAAFALGDVNGDGKLDIVAATNCNFGCPSAAVSVLPGNGDGTFGAPILSNLGREEDFRSLLIADFNGDHKLDVSVLGYNTNAAWALLGNADDTFQAPEKYRTGLKRTSSSALADLNGDGKTDLVIATSCEKAKCIAPDFNLLVLLNVFYVNTTTVVTSSVNPSVINQNVTFTATISTSQAVPDGELVTFSSGKVVLGTAPTNGGVATFTIALTKAKIYTIKATYPGDLYHKASYGKVIQVVTH